MFKKTDHSPSKSNQRRTFIKSSILGAGTLVTGQHAIRGVGEIFGDKKVQLKGKQRLSLRKLKKWESLDYGMFIHFGMSTFDGNELSNGTADPSLYAPDKLNVDQWISVAKEAGMKYAVLTTKHVAGHCLWPSKYTDYTVANSGNKRDVVLKFINACKKYGIKPGFYYCSWDNHHKFGSKTPTDIKWSSVMNSFPMAKGEMAPFTSSMYQTFQATQINELLNNYGPIMEMWVDIPGVLGPGYRTYLYEQIAKADPNIIIMMNNGIGDGEKYNVDYAWPADIIAIERNIPPESGHKKWRTINGEEYYMPGEVCDPIGKNWFYVEGDKPRPDKELAEQYLSIRKRGANFLLNVPPDKHGLIPEDFVNALLRLKQNVGIV